MAISIGRQASMYIYGMILVCHRGGGGEKEKGFKLLHSLNHHKLATVIKEVSGKIIKLHDDNAVLSHYDPIGITSAMTNSIATIYADGARK
ncbi:F-box protein [Pyrus ussuriensis x Pyrus communis]|uniref:F-box protein n=1 Tax=Pyrus ussuriensis x Pyrus communis TaxID=2448454 RepID=A0A5N5GZ50_9ROSA|nr:F-box protein [Pyrus ussuriensis x Pyrus communis]